MANFNDKGVTRIRRNPGGSYTVTIGGDIVDGEVVDVYAEYSAVPDVVIDSRVQVRSEGENQFTESVVEVTTRDGGIVHVHPTPGQLSEEARRSS